MDFISQMLNDEEILSKYKDIDDHNQTPSNHGIKHIINVVNIADKFGRLFNISERELLMLKTAEVLHDIGQVGGERKDHWVKSTEFAKYYLPSKNIFNDKELQIIYSAILTHDEVFDYSKFESKFSWLVALIDKLDFAKDRLTDNYEEKFGYLNSSDIERLDFALENNELKISIKTIKNPKIIAPENIYNRNLICMAMTLFQAFADKFGYIPKLFLNMQELDLTKFKKETIIKR